MGPIRVFDGAATPIQQYFPLFMAKIFLGKSLNTPTTVLAMGLTGLMDRVMAVGEATFKVLRHRSQHHWQIARRLA